jgi:hypothetical protein
MCPAMETVDLQTSDCNATFKSKCCNVSWHGDRGPTDQWLQSSIQNVEMCLDKGTEDRLTCDCKATFNSKVTSDCKAAFNSKCCNVSCHGDRWPTDQWLQSNIQFKMLQCVLTWRPGTYRPVIAKQHSIQNVALCLAMGTGDLQTSGCKAAFNSKCCNVSCHGDRRPTDQWLQCNIQFKMLHRVLTCRPGTYRPVIGRAHTTGENGEWGKTKQRSENQVAFNSVLGPS